MDAAPVAQPTLAGLLDEAAHGFLVVDAQGRLADANETFLAWVHAADEGWRGAQLTQFLAPASSIYFDTHVMPQTAMTGRIDEVAIDLQVGSARLPVLASTRRHQRPGGPWVSLTLLRIEERRRYERELLAERRRAEDALVQLRDTQARLLATSRAAALNVAATSLAHELNQPLMAGSTYLALAKRLPADTAGHLEAIENGARAILAAGDIVRRLRRVTAGQHRPDAAFDANAIIDAAWQIIGAAPGIERVRVEIAASVPRVNGDVDQIGYALAELVMNALEATADCGTRLVRLHAVPTPGDMLKISIDDNGPGLPADDVFTLGFSTKDGHCGLGLANARTIVEAHHGTIAFEPSGLGGCCIALSLPGAFRPSLP